MIMTVVTALRLPSLLLVIAGWCCATGALAQPANNDPCGAVTLTPGVNCTNTTGTNVAATATGGIPAPGCAGYSGGDVWYQVTVPASGQVTVTTSAVFFSPFTDSGIAFYTASSCSGPFTLVGCDNNSGAGSMSQLTYTGAVGTVLWVRVWENGNNSFGQFNICATAPAPPLVNNDPCGAIALSVTANCSFSSYTTVGATNSSGWPNPGCGNYGAGSLDVWFSFVAPPSGIAIIETQAGSLTDVAMALYADAPPAGCAGPFTLVSCDDDSGPGTMPFLSFTGLNAGWTYYIRVWAYSSGASGTFNLCLHGPSSIPAGGCVYMLELFDSFGDGWGSSNVGVSINGGAFTTYSITGNYNVVLFGFNIGDIVVLQYTGSGPNQGQNSYELSFLSGGALVFASGSPPATGITFTQTVTCISPAPPATDCIGGTTVCSGQSFNNNSTGTGSVVDLNASNRGCLTSNERQGTWYFFSPSASGTIGFTIAPVVATDYDFAVWGPFPPGTPAGSMCVPPGPPIRCSYSALTGNTGLGNGATDLSEGAGGNAWVAPLNVNVGEIYVLYVDNFSTNGQAFSLSWQLTNGASLDCTVLPIELLTFEGEANGSGIGLRWATATETDNDRFIVERMDASGEFVPIGTVPGAGTTNERTEYGFLDGAPTTGMNYYRLQQIDTDGASQRSHTISVRFVPTTGALVVYPNPGNGTVGIACTHANGSLITFVDATGREVLHHRLDADRCSVDVSILPRGCYAVNLSSATGALLSRTVWMKH